jgi:hypothetical protein
MYAKLDKYTEANRGDSSGQYNTETTNDIIINDQNLSIKVSSINGLKV